MDKYPFSVISFLDIFRYNRVRLPLIPLAMNSIPLFPRAFDSKLRKDKNLFTYRTWAKGLAPNAPILFLCSPYLLLKFRHSIVSFCSNDLIIAAPPSDLISLEVISRCTRVAEFGIT